MKYKITEAAKAAGVSKATLHRARENGKISAERNEKGHFLFDASELHRVFPRDGETTHEAHDEARRDDSEAVRIASLETKLEAVERLADERAKTIDDLRARLDKESEERRKMTALLTDQRPKGFWARLRGS